MKRLARPLPTVQKFKAHRAVTRQKNHGRAAQDFKKIAAVEADLIAQDEQRRRTQSMLEVFMQELHETALKSLALDDVSGKIPLHIPNPHGYAVIGLAADIDHMMDVMALTARHHVPVVMIAGDLHKDAAATLTDILARHPSPQGRIQIVCLNWGDSALPQPE